MRPIPKIIGLCGYAGTGKDTVADLLVHHAGFSKIAFADALRAEAAEGFCVEPIVFTRRELKDKPLSELALRRAPLEMRGAILSSMSGTDTFGPIDGWLDAPRTPRQILQWWGSEYRRAQNSLYWVEKAKQRMHELAERGHGRVAITDVRFQNEATLIRDMLGEVWQLVRPGIDAGTTTEGAHQSASDGTQFAPEAVIRNAGTLDDLRSTVLRTWWQHEAGVVIHALELEAA